MNKIILIFISVILLTSCTFKKEVSHTNINPEETLVNIYKDVINEIEEYGVSEEKRDEAVKFLVENYNNYFKDNETMEKVYYYGNYLAKGYANDEMKEYALLGVDAYEAVKDVYCGRESKENKLNIEFIKETLNKLGYSVE